MKKDIAVQQLAPQSGENVLYNPDDTIRLEVRMNEETVWLTQSQIALLFGCSVDNVGLHLKNIFEEDELDKKSTTEIFSVVRSEGSRMVKRNVLHYNLDAILSVGYRVSSRNATKFRQWANLRLKKSHDRFLILDDDVYHVGASLKDLGKQWFAIMKMSEIIAGDILGKI